MVYRSDDPKQLFVRIREEDGAWGEILTVPNDLEKQVNQSAVFDSNGILHIAWVEYSDVESGIYYITYNSDTALWGTKTKIGETSDYRSLTSMWLDSDNNPHIAWSYWDDGYIYTNDYDGSVWSGAVQAVDMGGTSYNYNYHKISFFENSGGNYLLLWLDDDGVHYSLFDSNLAVWNTSDLATPSTSATYPKYLDYSAAAAGPEIHLAFIYEYFDNNDFFINTYYTSFNGASWTAPLDANVDAEPGFMKIVFNKSSGNPEIYKTRSGIKGLFRSIYDPVTTTWTEPSRINPVEGADFEEGDLVITGTGEVVAGFTKYISWGVGYIYAYTSMDDSSDLLPGRPAVSLTEDESNSQFTIEFESESDSGILGYFLAVGTAPGKDDLKSWTTDFIPSPYTLKLESLALPYMECQTYYASVIAVDENGYFSRMGSGQLFVSDLCP
jgi:hypothetical protein